MIGCYCSHLTLLPRSLNNTAYAMSSKPWKRRQDLQEKAKLARSKLAKRHSNVEERPQSGDVTQSASSIATETTADTSNPLQASTESAASIDLSQQLADDQILASIDEWVLALPREDSQMLTMLLLETFRKEFGLGTMPAAAKVSNIIHHTEQTVRQWTDEFREHGEFEQSRVGQYERLSITDDEELCGKATAWVREHANIKGQPNMTMPDFCQHINNEILPSSFLSPGFPRKICLESARKLLYHLGFKRVDTGKKGVYIDGHERPDVVQEQELFLQKIQDYDTSHLPPPCPSDCLHVDCSPTTDHTLEQLIIICHDESAFQSNEDQTFSWLQHDQIVIKPKSRGSGRMVSDFVDEHSGFLRLTEEEFEIV